MSLEQLIHTVSKKINLSEELTLNKLNNIAEIVKDESFSLKKLKSYGFQEEEASKILDELSWQEYASTFYAYDCEQFDSMGTALALTEKCEYCGEILKESSSHIIKKMFRLNNCFLELIKERRKSELQKYVISDYMPNLQSLIDSSERIIPFLGAGISTPLGLPDWKELLLQLKRGLTEKDTEQYETLISRGDYLRALTFLNRYSGFFKDKRLIKREITNIIKSKYNKNLDDNLHNIRDILKLNSDFYITTNYDNALTDYRDEFVMPLCIDEIEDTQELLNEKEHRVIHLHGHIDKPKSMIVDEDDYNTLYSDPRITSKLYSILGNRKLLFIGFSFNDRYFKDLYSKIIENIGEEHFIIVPNLHVFDAEEYFKMNLIPIGINVKKDKNGKYLDYVKALKVVLEQLT